MNVVFQAALSTHISRTPTAGSQALSPVTIIHVSGALVKFAGFQVS